MERGCKRLVICCDGTWNEPDQLIQDNLADETEPTNVPQVACGSQIRLAQSQGGFSSYVLARTIEPTVKLCILLHNKE